VPPVRSGSLRSSVVIVTGGGSGLGAAFARRLARDEARVIVCDIDEQKATAVALDIKGAVAVVDVTDSEAVDREVDNVIERHGRLDVMINNAGIAPPPDATRFERAMANQMLRIEGRVDEMAPLDALVGLTDERFDRMIRTHLYGVFHGTRAALRHMTPQRSGSIINMSSILGVHPSGGPPDYTAAKAGIIALTKSVASEVAHLGIRVNAVCPGYVDTPLLAPYDDEMRGAITMRIGMGRMASADEIAELVRFLAGPESSYSTGEVYTASGGYE
jgi:NAD(P)-dependent dehydrogenase (short-subunit alcohol dehydrogenase family)